MKHKSYYFKIAMAATMLAICSACTDFLSVDPPRTQIAGTQVFSDDATATSAITGVYASMMNSGTFASGGSGSMTLQAGLSSDELMDIANSSDSRQFFRNSLLVSNTTVDNVWSSLYQYIFYANTILENIVQSPSLSPVVRNQVKGEAHFIRAFSYFYLINLFGDVPLALTTDYRVNASLERSHSDIVYAAITSDLLAAKDLMGEDYSHASGRRVRPNKYAASALLARVYLYNSEWQLATDEANAVIGKPSLYKMSESLDEVFLINSQEAIWQLMPTTPQYNTFEGLIFHSVSIAAISEELMNSFDSDDLRKSSWTIQQSSGLGTYQSPNKYKIGEIGQPLSEYSMVLRLAEMYLVRAEARAHLADFDGANEDINAIRTRAGLNPVDLDSEEALISEALQQRKIELFSEWGHRWLDLKRTSTANQILAPIKSEWNETDILYPIPKIERDNNIRLTQNPGY
jgi:hypothetical protein